MDAQHEFETRLRAATKLADAGKKDAALADWKELRCHLPDRPSSYLLAADLLRSMRMFREAETLIACGISRFPQNYWCCRQLAQVAQEQNQLDEARRLLEHFIALFPTASILLVDLASLYIELGMTEKSETLTAAAIKDFPDEKGLHYAFAEAAATKGETEVARQRWTGIRDRWPNDIAPAKRLIRLLRDKRSTEARSVIDAALEAFPGEHEFLIEAIHCREEAQAWEQVQARWREFRHLYPSDPTADFGEAEALAKLGFVREADDLICSVFQAATSNGTASPLTERQIPGQTRPSPELRTVLFCTAYAGTPAAWNKRYRRWLDAVQQSNLEYSQILLVDDGSESLPNWPEAHIFRSVEEYDPSAPVAIYQFDTHLGRPSTFNFPGWYRSFGLPAQLVQRFGIGRLFHIESDAFVISDRLTRYFNSFTTGWAAMWPTRRGVPETGIQLIAGAELACYVDFVAIPHEKRIQRLFEKSIPITYSAKEFNGDRFGEDLNHVPWDADWTMQVPYDSSARYLWWMEPFRSQLRALSTARNTTCSSKG